VGKQIKNLLRRAMRHIQAQQMSLRSRVTAKLQLCTQKKLVVHWLKINLTDLLFMAE